MSWINGLPHINLICHFCRFSHVVAYANYVVVLLCGNPLEIRLKETSIWGKCFFQCFKLGHFTMYRAWILCRSLRKLPLGRKKKEIEEIVTSHVGVNLSQVRRRKIFEKRAQRQGWVAHGGYTILKVEESTQHQTKPQFQIYWHDEGNAKYCAIDSYCAINRSVF